MYSRQYLLMLVTYLPCRIALNQLKARSARFWLGRARNDIVTFRSLISHVFVVRVRISTMKVRRKIRERVRKNSGVLCPTAFHVGKFEILLCGGKLRIATFVGYSSFASGSRRCYLSWKINGETMHVCGTNFDRRNMFSFKFKSENFATVRQTISNPTLFESRSLNPFALFGANIYFLKLLFATTDFNLLLGVRRSFSTFYLFTNHPDVVNCTKGDRCRLRLCDVNPLYTVE